MNCRARYQPHWCRGQPGAAHPYAGGATPNLVDDAENRLTHVTSNLNNNLTILARFIYDGDGNRVKATQNGVTTLYIGSYAEWRPAASNKLLKY